METTIRQYLIGINQAMMVIHQNSGLHYVGMEDLLLQHGRQWESQQMPPEWSGKVDAYPKVCFDNAFRLASKSRGKLLYVEGYALGVIPVHHAWCATREGKVVDPTWGLSGSSIGQEYFGVAIPVSVVRGLRTKQNTSALLDHVHGFPLLSQPFQHQQP